jgi:hypothetical protein
MGGEGKKFKLQTKRKSEIKVEQGKKKTCVNHCGNQIG